MTGIYFAVQYKVTQLMVQGLVCIYTLKDDGFRKDNYYIYCTCIRIRIDHDCVSNRI